MTKMLQLCAIPSSQSNRKLPLPYFLQETKLVRADVTADISVADGFDSYFSFNRVIARGRRGYSGERKLRLAAEEH